MVLGKLFSTTLTGQERKSRSTRGFAKRSEALEYEREFLRKQTQSCDMKFSSLWELYLEDMEPRLRENTVQSKKFLVEKHILPFLEI